MASPSLFGVLGIAPQLGRAFTEQEGTLGNDGVAVLSHDLWVQRFGGRADIVGKEIRLAGQTLQIVGVMPAGFAFPNRIVQVWVPYAFTPQQASDAGRGSEFSISIGRLKPGATIAQLNSELGVIVRRVADRLPSIQDAVTVAGFTGKAQSWRQAEVGNLSQLLLVLQATVLAVLLIACANLANLQLARLTSRRRELALRTTLGATRAQLLRLVLARSRWCYRPSVRESGSWLPTAASRSCAHSASIARARATSSGSICECWPSRLALRSSPRWEPACCPRSARSARARPASRTTPGAARLAAARHARRAARSSWCRSPPAWRCSSAPAS